MTSLAFERTNVSEVQQWVTLDLSECTESCCAHPCLSAFDEVSISTAPNARPAIWTVTVSLLCGGYASSCLTGCGSLLRAQSITESTRSNAFEDSLTATAGTATLDHAPEQAVCSNWLYVHPTSSPATPKATQAI